MPGSAISRTHASRTGGIFDFENKKLQIESLEIETQHPEFWNEPERAQKLMRQLNDLKDGIEPWETLEHESAENLEMAQLLKEEGTEDSEDAEAIAALAARQPSATILASSKFRPF